MDDNKLNQPDRILRGEAEIRPVVLISKTERERRQAAGTFPYYFFVGPRSRGLLESDALAWQRWQLAIAEAKAAGTEPPPPPKWRAPKPPPKPEMHHPRRRKPRRPHMSREAAQQ